MALLFLMAPAARADVPKHIGDCVNIEESTKRLKCYDDLAGRKAAPIEPADAAVSGTKPESQAKLSYLERLWELNKESRRGKFSISPHRSNYILPITYVDSPNEQIIRETDPGKEHKTIEVAFQLSFKAKLWQDIFGQTMD